MIIHLIAKNRAALEILENSRIMDGRAVELPLHQKIKERLMDYYDIARPKGVWSDTQLKNDSQQEPGNYIDQNHWYPT